MRDETQLVSRGHRSPRLLLGWPRYDVFYRL